MGFPGPWSALDLNSARGEPAAGPASLFPAGSADSDPLEDGRGDPPAAFAAFSLARPTHHESTAPTAAADARVERV